MKTVRFEIEVAVGDGAQMGLYTAIATLIKEALAPEYPVVTIRGQANEIELQ